MARPTKSQLLFVQMAGRGTRIPEGVDNLLEWKAAGKTLEKQDCLIIDVVDNTSKHSLVTLASIFGIGPRVDLKGGSVVAAQESFNEAKKLNPDVDFDKLETLDDLQSYVEMVDLFTTVWPEEVEKFSKLQWHKTGENEYWLTLPTKEQVFVKQNLVESWDVGGEVNKTPFSIPGIHNLQEAFRVADSYITMLGREMLTLLRRKSSWHRKSCTLGQKTLITRLANQLMPELLGTSQLPNNEQR
jgi:hypothetical protein